MDKLKEIEQHPLNDEFGNTYGLSVPSRLELMNKLNEIIHKINDIIYVLDKNNIK